MRPIGTKAQMPSGNACAWYALVQLKSSYRNCASATSDVELEADKIW